MPSNSGSATLVCYHSNDGAPERESIAEAVLEALRFVAGNIGLDGIEDLAPHRRPRWPLRRARSACGRRRSRSFRWHRGSGPVPNSLTMRTSAFAGLPMAVRRSGREFIEEGVAEVELKRYTIGQRLPGEGGADAFFGSHWAVMIIPQEGTTYYTR